MTEKEATATEYVEFHRKYQPRVWDDFVGQEAVIAELKEDIIKNRHVQGRLFCGDAGRGKSSMARVFVKAMNCENRAPDSADPCLICDSCLRFDADPSQMMTTVVASVESGVDNVRTIVANGSVKRFAKAPFIVIDECHALSQPAWDAFLDYLENKDFQDTSPIIFCTTDKHKIKKDSINSRVKEYDFERIPSKTLEGYVQRIAEREGVEVSPEGLEWIARRAGGSARFALKYMEEYLRNPGLYSSRESAVTLLLRACLWGSIKQLNSALEQATETDSLADATEQAITLLLKYMSYVAKAEDVSNDELPFYDIPDQNLALDIMKQNIPPALALYLVQIFKQDFQGYWNVKDDSVIFSATWYNATYEVYKHKASLKKAKQPAGTQPQEGEHR